MKCHVSFVIHMQAVKWRLHWLSRELIAAGADRTFHYYFMYSIEGGGSVTVLCGTNLFATHSPLYAKFSWDLCCANRHCYLSRVLPFSPVGYHFNNVPSWSIVAHGVCFRCDQLTLCCSFGPQVDRWTFSHDLEKFLMSSCVILMTECRVSSLLCVGFHGLFNDALSSSDFMALNYYGWWVMNCKGRGRKRSWPNRGSIFLLCIAVSTKFSALLTQNFSVVLKLMDSINHSQCYH
jgi:hypothetical protein